MRALLPIGLAALALGCGEFPHTGPGTPGAHGCGDDLDCADDRVCVDGACVSRTAVQAGDCIHATASCGCPGRGYEGALTYVAYRVCGGSEQAEIVRRGDAATVSWTSGSESCSGTVESCEIGGLGRLLDQAFTGCPADEPPNPCAELGAVAYLMACREADGERCSLLPIGLPNACGESELLAGIQEVRDRVRADPESLCD